MQTQIDVREEIAVRLQKARKNAGFDSAESFCENAGISAKKYITHETGHKPIKASHAMQYCKLLSITLHWLMLGSDNLKRTNAARRKPATNNDVSPE